MLVGLAPGHPILAQGKKIASVSYDNKRKLTQMQITGKKKHGSADMDPHSPLCIITCEDGSKHIVYAGVRSHLFELNMVKQQNHNRNLAPS